MAFVRATVALASIAKTITAPILLLALRSAAFVAGFFPSFAIFALVWDLLRNFGFYSLASLLVLPFLLRLSILLSLSPKVASLRCFSCWPPSLVVPVYMFGVFLSVAAVLCLLPLLLLGVARALAGTPLVCLFSFSWGTCGFSALCHAAG